MAANKKRQALTQKDMLSIVESTEGELLEASRQLAESSDQILDGVFDAGIFERLVKEKKLQASTILVQDKPAYVLIHGFNAVGWLVVEGAVMIGKTPLRHLFEGGYALARHLGAPKIVFVTKLSPLFRYATDHCFKSLGVMLCIDTPQAEIPIATLPGKGAR